MMYNRQLARSGAFCLLILTMATDAANLGAARYDATDDSIVVTLSYRGTHPDHEFSIEWGHCETTAEGAYAISARIVDSQWNDRAAQQFESTRRFMLTSLRCRPATVTLISAPDSRINIVVPAIGNANRASRGPLIDGH